MNRAYAWKSKRPIQNTLPCFSGAYQNELTKILIKYWDELVIHIKELIEDLPRQLDANTCDEEFLPLLGYMAGFTGEYSILEYPLEVQRELILNSSNFIWRYKGTDKVLDYLLDILGIPHLLSYGSLFIVGISTSPHLFAESNFSAYLLLPIGIERNSAEWNLAQQILNLYSPAYSDIHMCYDGFYPSISAPGDPVFDEATLSVTEGHYVPN